MFSHVGTITPDSVFSDPGGALPPIVDARCAAPRVSRNNRHAFKGYIPINAPPPPPTGSSRVPRAERRACEAGADGSTDRRTRPRKKRRGRSVRGRVCRE